MQQIVETQEPGSLKTQDADLLKLQYPGSFKTQDAGSLEGASDNKKPKLDINK